MSDDLENVREDDVEVVPPDGEDEGPSQLSLPDKVRILQQTLKQRTTEAAEANEKYIRTAADFDNFRKRKQREIEEFRKYANEQLASELLSVVDHMGLAIKHAGEVGGSAQGMLQGVELVYKQLTDVLDKFGVKKFVSEGESFDPVRHDAMLQVPTDQVPENTVIQVLQDGYLYHEKVLRHAKVGVSKRPDGDEQVPGSGENKEENSVDEPVND
jgi:molecular chaperone GrpE